MANNKTSFAYYAVDTDRYQDIKIKRLKKSFGCDGIAVYDYILCEIYRDKGCFLVWDENRAFDVADYFGLKENTVEEIVQWCCTCGLFDKSVLTSVGVLTSASIQRRFTDMCIKAKRKDCVIPENIRIIPEQSNIIPEQSQIITELSDKEKKSKVNKIADANILTIANDDKTAASVLRKWNSTKNLPHISGMTQSEKTYIESLVDSYGLENVLETIDYCDESKSLNGNNKSTFKVKFCWFRNIENFKTLYDEVFELRLKRQQTIDAESERNGRIELQEKRELELVKTKREVYNRLSESNFDFANRWQEYEDIVQNEVKKLNL
ncbi:MAG: DUF4373 domain-containing protein [Paludibacteraceae bacterium]|nr:DUF4373 domain-containing protein [Paludibacteraceae bacterium]